MGSHQRAKRFTESRKGVNDSEANESFNLGVVREISERNGGEEDMGDGFWEGLEDCRLRFSWRAVGGDDEDDVETVLDDESFCELYHGD